MYHLAVDNWKVPPQEFFELLSPLSPGMFDKIVDQHTDNPNDAALIIKYIILAYSKDSKYVVLGSLYADQKASIANALGLPDQIMSDVLNMNLFDVRQAISDYLNYQKCRDWTHLVRNMEIYESMGDSALVNMKDDKGKVDFKAIIDAAKYRNELLSSIKEMEEQFKNEYRFVEENLIEIKAIENKTKGLGLAIEDSDSIK